MKKKTCKKKETKAEKKTRWESYSVLKKKTKKKICKKWQFWKKRKTNKNNKKNMWGKLKLDYQLAQYWKNKFDKDNFLKKYVVKHCSKTKTM